MMMISNKPLNGLNGRIKPKLFQIRLTIKLIIKKRKRMKRML